MTIYRMPAHLSDFKRDMYIHLIDWKRRHLTDKPGHYAGHAYDAVLPEELSHCLTWLGWCHWANPVGIYSSALYNIAIHSLKGIDT